MSLKFNAVLFHPVERQHLQRVHLEGAQRLALQFLRRVEPRLCDQDAALDAAAGDDLHRRAGVEQCDEAGVRDQPRVHLAGAEERDLLGEGGRDDEVEHHAIVLGRLQRVRQEVVQVAEAGAVRRFDMRLGGVRGACAEGERQRAGGGGAQEAAPAEARGAQSGQVDRAVFTHDDSSWKVRQGHMRAACHMWRRENAGVGVAMFGDGTGSSPKLAAPPPQPSPLRRGGSVAGLPPLRSGGGLGRGASDLPRSIHPLEPGRCASPTLRSAPSAAPSPSSSMRPRSPHWKARRSPPRCRPRASSRSAEP